MNQTNINDNDKWFNVNVLGVSFDVCDYVNSQSVDYIQRDLNKDIYGTNDITFLENDWVIDLGANNGMFSAYLALRYPFLKIIALEARSDNYYHLFNTLYKNNIQNVIPLNVAIAMDDREITISGSTENSGGGSIYRDWWGNVKFPEIIDTCPTISLDKLFRMFGIKQCKFIKCDVEGAEYEVFLNSKRLGDVEYLSAEIHPQPEMYKNINMDDFIRYIKNSIKNPNNFKVSMS